MLRKAQRAAVVKAMQASVASNQDIRNETNRFNLISCPGYAELLDEMITLNTDRKETAFVIGDAPLRLAPDSSSTQAWASNSGNATENGEDGLVSKYAYSAVYYPHGVSTNLDGSSIVIPSSSIALRTFAYNDQVAFPWFAPAGFNRGGLSDGAAGIPVTNVSQKLTSKERDKLYESNINPIASFPSSGIVVFGQKTLQADRSALDRINVRRMLIYVKQGLSQISSNFLFEPNVQDTWNRFLSEANPFLLDVQQQFGIDEYRLILGENTTTPDLIDQNILYAKLFIKPTRAIEFIAVDFFITNSGASFED